MRKPAHSAALDALIGDIYEAGLNPQLWPDVLTHVLSQLGAHAGQLWTPTLPDPQQGGLVIERSIDAGMYHAYLAHFHACDLWKQRVIELGLLHTGATYLDAQLLPEHEWRGSEFWNDFLRQQEFFRLCGGVIDDGLRSGSPPVAIACYRGPRATPFGLHEKAVLDRLQPHLNRALRMRAHLNTAHASAAEAALDALETPVAVLGRMGRLLLLNAAAQRLLATRKDPSVRWGCFRLADGEAQRRLDALLAHAQQGYHALENTPATVQVGDPAQGGLVLSVVPAGARGPYGKGQAVAVVFLRPAHPQAPPDAQLLRAVYGLTATEASLAMALAQGQTLGAFATVRGVSTHTVRAQLRQVFDKTGVSRQVDLVRLIQAGVP